MDLPRTDQHVRRRKRMIATGIAVLLLAGIAIALANIGPAMPVIDRSLVWIDTVERGTMLRQVRGVGTLVPEEIAWLAARTDARVERILLRPGAVVEPDSVILVLNNPSVVQAAADADSELRAAEAAAVAYKAQLQMAALEVESAAAAAKAAYEQAKLKAEMNERLFEKGLVPEIELRLSTVTATESATHHDIERKRFAFTRESIGPQLAAKRAGVDRLRAQAKLRHDELAALQVQAGMDGVLQSLPVEVGAQVAPGDNLARVANPTQLKAELRIPETQAKDVRIGLPVSVDTRNGLIAGRVSRIDPAAKNGSVTLDVMLEGELPLGARPDLSVDGTIELERLNDAVFVTRPAAGQERSTISLFKLEADGRHARRVNVKLGRSSVSSIEIIEGLQPGDRVVLSEMSQWDHADRVRLE